MTAALLLQSAIIGVSIGSIYILMALGLTLMFGMMHIINFAHGAVYMLGAFVIYYIFFQWGAPYFVAFLAAMLLLGIFGYLVERCIYRPIKGGIEPTLVALLEAFIIIILGGLGSIPGAILGGLMLGLIDSTVATALGAEPAFLLSFVFIILLLFFRPAGLFGHAQ